VRSDALYWRWIYFRSEFTTSSFGFVLFFVRHGLFGLHVHTNNRLYRVFCRRFLGYVLVSGWVWVGLNMGFERQVCFDTYTLRSLFGWDLD